jgi:hypothetical protein
MKRRTRTLVMLLFAAPLLFGQETLQRILTPAQRIDSLALSKLFPRGLPDTLIAGTFRIVVERWDVKSKSADRDLPSGIGRIQFSCGSIIHPLPWKNLRLIQKKFSVTTNVTDSASQLSLSEARLIEPTIQPGQTLSLDLPLRNTLVESLRDRNFLVDQFRFPRLQGIRVAFRDVEWSGPVKKTVTLTDGVAWYPSESPVPTPPARVAISSGFTLAIDSLFITTSYATVMGSILLPPCLVSTANCTPASVSLPPTRITADCRLYRQVPDSTFGPFVIGETGLQISGRGYTIDFSTTQSDPAVSPALAASWKGVVLKNGETPDPPADTVMSNRGYLKAKYAFTNGLITASGLAAQLRLQSPFVFKTLEPIDYLVSIHSTDGFLNISACGITDGLFKDGYVTLPRRAVRSLTGGEIRAAFATLEVQPDMDLYAEVKVGGGFTWGEFSKTAGAPAFYTVGRDTSGAPATGYFYLAARAMKPYYPVSGGIFTSPNIFPANTQLEALQMQGVTLTSMSRRKFTIWTQDVPINNPLQRKIEIPEGLISVRWMNIIGTGVHSEVWIVQFTGKDNLDSVSLGPTWMTTPPYKGEVPFLTSWMIRRQEKFMKLQFVESTVWDSDIHGRIFVKGAVNDTLAFNKLMFTSTANAGGAQLDLSKSVTMDYWGVQLVPKDSTQSSGVVVIKQGVIYLTAAGIYEPRHYATPFWLTWGELKASGNLGRLFFDYNNVGQKFDRFPFTPNLIALSPYTPGDTGYVHTYGPLAINFFGSKMMSISDWKAPSLPGDPFNNRLVRIRTTPHMGAGPSDLSWFRDWGDGLAELNFTAMAYDSVAQDGFLGTGNVSLLQMITFSSSLSASINVKAERTCFTMSVASQLSVNMGPLATATAMGNIWGCGCIIGESLERIAVGGELSANAGIGLSILARTGGALTATISVAPSRVATFISGDMFLVVGGNNVAISGFASLIVDRTQATYVEGYCRGLVDMSSFLATPTGGIAASSVQAAGEFDWHIGTDFQTFQGRVGVSMYGFAGQAVPIPIGAGAGGGVEAGLFIGINAPKDRAWVMDGISGRFGLNKAALPARLTGFYGFTSFSASVSLFIVSGGFQAYAGFGAFVGTGSPVTGFAFGVIGNVGIRIWGEILGGLVSAAAWGQLTIIVGVPPGFEGAVGLEACVLWVFCGSVTVHGGFNAEQGFYLY